MLLKIHPDNPNPRHIQTVLDCLIDGGIIIYPTDTVYGIGCDIYKTKAVEKIALIKGIKKEKANFSFICSNLSHISDFTHPINNEVYKMMKRNLPGPFTFILEANNKVPKLFQSKKKTVGIRVPDNNIIHEIVQKLGNPIMSSSVYDEDEIIEYTTDPELIHEKYGHLVDIVIDGGYGDNLPSTIVDCTQDEITVIREGKGILQ
ncbi:MAG: threonylcarbamoyl-AMP synthase [Bacteroidetes bacterium HGW-Bacteroidetes-17]|jgi:tRNA threonylcarbamoyl adenosine modification protein (Sua5/YciO/YrdC/YwlC family)|nr:MAG: threonylcarbamoyl-AMP synthase [Bacteroidetes bacterium HGW-Bacteroidetes-17]